MSRIGSVLFKKLGLMLQDTNLSKVAGPNDGHLMFSVEPLLLVHFGISKKLNDHRVAFLSSYKKETSSFPPKKYRKNVNFFKQQILNGCNNLLVGYKKDFYVSDLQTYFSSLQTSSERNAFFTSREVKHC